ncbi:lipid II flippase FtsW [Andreesenia angusta]|uniref:Probable peptidoglycan glycosyltransferase FtsW n=1 Tax=Andreesenia angusta TaxID=39480 RepID=A0A1S1V8T8_9FIRM|nr:putative lipid II flippase FtsW [Andreesenia angusta]OHW63031.1 lipid II flippase FtsW [Andreesenia angusta]
MEKKESGDRKKPRGKKPPVDFVLLAAIIGIIVIGLVMVFSSSWPDAISNPAYKGDGMHFFKRQLVFFVVGLLGMAIASRIDYRFWKRIAPVMYVCSLILGAAVMTPLGVELNGAKRWINVGVTLLMPSDIMKISAVIFLAAFMSRRKRKMKKFGDGFLYAMLIIAIPCAIILGLQSDLGTSGMLGITLFIMLFIGGGRMTYLACTGLLGVAAGGLLAYTKPYRWRRVTTFLDPFKDKYGDGWQVVQSLYAIGSGGVMGAGLGQSKQKYYYIPEPYSDFIFSIFAEEFGFLGVAIVLGLYAAVAWRGFKIAISAKDSFGSYLAVGITSLVMVQTAIHIAVVSSSMPATGITMPFMSYGGTSLVIYMFAIGILLNISRNMKMNRS